MLLFGFIVAAICGYMAGLIGSSNSPISGVGILAVVGMLHDSGDSSSRARPAKALVAIALFITAILFAAACSSNDNLQDLKTGQLVGDAPWRQQVALAGRRGGGLAGHFPSCSIFWPRLMGLPAPPICTPSPPIRWRRRRPI